MKEYISVGKNVDLAINEGLVYLGLNREDVDIKILETGGLFKKAKVCLMYEEKKEDIPTIEQKNETDLINEVAEQAQVEAVQEEKIEQLSEENKVTEVVQKIEEKAQLEIVENEQQVKEIVEPTELIARVKKFIVDLSKKMNIEVNVEHEIENNDINFKVSGQNVGKLIGYRGETMNAIQILLGGLKRSGEGKYRLYIDIENYKKVREQTIVDLANKMADKAEEIERNVHLEPMSAYERRIVHSALQNRELVETESMGEGEKRHVVIKFKR